jgi:hypothetical protein
MPITAHFTVDIAPSIRTAVNDAAFNQLIYADQLVEVDFLENGTAWAPPTGSTWELVLVNRESPTSGVLARSSAFTPAPNSVATSLTFTISTNTVELKAYLADSRGKNLIVELTRTDASPDQTFVRWFVTMYSQGWDPNSAVYAQLQHHTTCNPDREPTADDDSLLGFGIGSIWVWCGGNSVWLCTDATPGAAIWKCWFDYLVPSAELGTSVPLSVGNIPMDSVASVREGMAIQVVQSGASTWHVITAVNVDSIDLMGPALAVGTQIDMIRIMENPLLLQCQVSQSCWDAATGYLLAPIEKTGFTYEGERGHIVGFRAMQMEVDATTQGRLQVRANGSRVSIANGGLGPQLGAVGVWVDCPATSIDKLVYTVNREDVIELECSAVGVPGTGRFLTCKLVIVTER